MWELFKIILWQQSIFCKEQDFKKQRSESRRLKRHKNFDQLDIWAKREIEWTHFLVSVFFIKKSLYIVRLCLHVIVVKINEIWIKKLRENWPGGRIIQKFFVRHRNHKARLVDDINVVWKKSWSVFWMKRYPLFRGWSWWFLVQMHWWIVCLSLLLVQQIYWNRREKLCHISIYLISSSLAHPKEPTCIFCRIFRNFRNWSYRRRRLIF